MARSAPFDLGLGPDERKKASTTLWRRSSRGSPGQRSAGDVDEELLEACLVDRAEHGIDLPGGTDHHDGVLDRDGESNEGLP